MKVPMLRQKNNEKYIFRIGFTDLGIGFLHLEDWWYVYLKEHTFRQATEARQKEDHCMRVCLDLCLNR